MTIQAVIPLFPHFTALDGIGPYEVLQRIPDDRRHLHRSRARRGSQRERLPRHHASTPRSRRSPTPTSIVFPGGVGTRPLATTNACWSGFALPTHRRRSRRRCAPARSCSAPRVCSTVSPPPRTGRATTSWRRRARSPVADRVVEHLDRRIITAAGVSSGIDMALRLVELLFDRTAAEASQLMIEYDPQPPFDAGALAKGDDDDRQSVHRVRREYASSEQRACQTVVVQNVSPAGRSTRW